MTREEYRRQLLEHATQRGYGPPRLETAEHPYEALDGSKQVHVTRDWVFATGNGTEVRVTYDPDSGLLGWLVNAKGRLTAAQNTTGKPLRKRNKPPSRESDEPWLYAHAPDASELDPDVSGKWMMFVARDKIDDTWKNVAAAVTEGRLAPHAKVSTSATNCEGTRPHVLCVYVADYRDLEDVMAVRQLLREMGFQRKIPFKLNETSRRGERGSLFSA